MASHERRFSNLQIKREFGVFVDSSLALGEIDLYELEMMQAQLRGEFFGPLAIEIAKWRDVEKLGCVIGIPENGATP